MQLKPREKPLFIYDGDCGFCRRWIARWQALTKDQIEYAPYQETAAQFPEIPEEQFQASVKLIDTDGQLFSGAEAIVRTLAHVPEKRWLLRLYKELPAAAPIAEWGYRIIARHRARLSPPRCPTPPETYSVSRWIFLRAMGLIYLIAFASLWVQVEGLLGPHGIAPVHDFLELLRRQMGPERYWLVPTVFWLNAGSLALRLVCAGGVFFSLLLIARIAPAASLIFLWALYLSLSSVAQEFLNFQWDALLLETGLLSIFFALAPSRIVLWLLRWLLFRLIFSSGVVKLASGDPTWANLTALTFHYQTQPLPTWIGWTAHQLPVWFQKFSCGVMFAVELGAPWLILGGRRLRRIGLAAIAALQGLILLTGNYCFFNWLTIALCLLFIEDAAWLRLEEAAPFVSWPRWFQERAAVKKRRWPGWIIPPAAAVIFLVSSFHLFGLLRRDIEWPAAVSGLSNLLAPYRSVNSYGLFAVMTTSRPEIIVEGSRDGITWLPYEFKYKPGELKRKPAFVAPYQPRLDWQLWFAALSRVQDNPWFLSFCVRLLEGSPQVLALLKTNPFPEKPPRYIRAVLYDYRFTDLSGRRATGQWWRREFKGVYCPVLSLRSETP
ncbi:MAG: lipase maturation factor family protein [Candidatus Omnitrophica bacterium]|nr:lipase maturation factor family protein [Candidatus Omnitrophota bacterium]